MKFGLKFFTKKIKFKFKPFSMTFLTKKSTLKFFGKNFLGLRKFFKISSYASDTVCVGSITLCARHNLGLRKFFKIRSYALVYIINLHTPKIRFENFEWPK